MSSLVNTGVQWIPQINSAWKIGRVKDIFYISKELSTKENPIILSLARSSVKVRDITNNEGQLAASYENYNSVKVGDLLLNPMDLYSGANCNVSYVEGVISPAYSNLRTKIKLIPQYYDYYFKTQYWTMAMFAHGKGVSFDNRWTLNSDGLLNYEVPILSYEEQEKIVAILDKKVQQIDALISNQEKQIEKLKKYKVAIISKIIAQETKKTIKLKYISTIYTGNSIPDGEKDFYTNKKIPYIPTKAINTINQSIDYENGLSVDENDGFKIAHKNSTLLCIEGGSAGKKIGYLKCDVAFVNKLCCLEAKNVDSKFLYYSLQSTYLLNQFNLHLLGLIGGVSVNELKNLQIYYPSSIETQKQIVKKMEYKINEIDKLMKLKQSKIEKLQEYKKSLIYEYVTGKKEAN